MDKILGFFGEYRFLSNFWSCPVEYEGDYFKSTEAAYQAAKSLDPEVRKQFIPLKPREAKDLGNKIEKRKDWDEVKVSVMRLVLRRKFRLPELRKQLLATGNAYLEETNTWNDTTWGVCRGVGTNYLGKLLMEIRDEIREEEANS
jgi:ribA/ribD-fused uncharacterized protein